MFMVRPVLLHIQRLVSLAFSITLKLYPKRAAQAIYPEWAPDGFRDSENKPQSTYRGNTAFDGLGKHRTAGNSYTKTLSSWSSMRLPATSLSGPVDPSDRISPSVEHGYSFPRCPLGSINIGLMIQVPSSSS